VLRVRVSARVKVGVRGRGRGRVSNLSGILCNTSIITLFDFTRYSLFGQGTTDKNKKRTRSDTKCGANTMYNRQNMERTNTGSTQSTGS
jgi:hypothetical protein